MTIDLISELNPNAKISSDLFDYNEVLEENRIVELSKEKIDYYF
jgi:hypothetical protein